MLPHDPLPNFVHLGIIVVTIFQLSSSSPHISIFFIIIKARHINLRAGFVSFTCPLNYVWSYAFVKSSSQLILLFLLPITCNGNIYTICIGVWFLIFCVHDPGSNSLALIMGLSWVSCGILIPQSIHCSHILRTRSPFDFFHSTEICYVSFVGSSFIKKVLLASLIA